MNSIGPSPLVPVPPSDEHGWSSTHPHQPCPAFLFGFEQALQNHLMMVWGQMDRLPILVTLDDAMKTRYPYFLLLPCYPITQPSRYFAGLNFP